MKTVNHFSKLLFTFLTLFTLNNPLFAQVEKGTNGRNANVVEYAGTSSEAPGAFKQADAKTWVEVKNGKAGYHATFTELDRDDWSVYLKKSDGLNVQLDLHTKKVKLNGRNYYEISKAINQVNGWNANVVQYKATATELAGSFKQTGGFTWAEFKEGKKETHGTFKETNRDAWTVYMTKSDGLKLTLNLHTKKVSINGGAYYDITKTSNKPNGRIATLVEYVGNSAHPGGTFKQIGSKTWAEYKRGKTGAQSTFTEDNRDDWSVYLTKSDGLKIQIDLWTNKIKLNGADYYDIIAASCVATKDTKANNSLIHFPGTGETLSVAQLESKLKKGGFTLVQTGELEPNQCALVYPNVDKDDISAEFGIMMCAHQFGDNVTLDQAVIHGGCDAANPMTQGVGAKCSVGVLKQNLKVKFDGGETNFKVSGPTAEVCSAASSEFICFNAGATLASTSFEVKDDRGNGVGIGVSAGVGYGLDGGYEDGVISGSLDLKIVAGASISFSLNTDDLVTGASTIGETGYVIVKDEVVAASQSTVDYFEKDFTRDVVVVGEDAIGFAEDAGKEIEKGGNAVIKVGEGAIKEISSWF